MRHLAAARALVNAARRNDPNGRLAGARRRANQAAAARRHNAARIIQAYARGMRVRSRMANTRRTYANVVAGRGLGYKAIMAMMQRPNNMAALGARIRAGIRYGPEHYVSGRRHPRWSTPESRCMSGLCALGSMPRGYSTRTRTPPRRRSPGRNNNLYH
jgi:hypothetical protein